jgi:alkylated DNA repair dioxygenase AlkB
MAQSSPRQRSLFDSGEPRFDHRLARLRRIPLDRGAWLDHMPGWLEGHEALLDTLWWTIGWRSERRQMYERVVDVPRLMATVPDDGSGHPILPTMAHALSAHYGRPLSSISLAAYRDGRDSVAFHGDRLGIRRADAIVAIVSLGFTRRFLLRRAGGGASRAFDLSGGDLLVMGGTCQLTWEHAVPKVAHAGLRISVQFRSGAPDPVA